MINNLNSNQSEIIVSSTDNIFLDNNSTWKRTIKLEKDSTLDIFGFFDSQTNYELDINLEGDNSELNLNYLIIWDKNENLKLKIRANISSSNSKANLNIISIVKNEGSIDIDWIIDIKKDISKSEWYLTEENVFIGSSWKIRWVPTLLIASDDVKANHAAKFEKISDEKLFYLRSRWLDEKDSVQVMLDWYFRKNFSKLENLDENVYNDLLEKFELKLNN